MISYKRQKWDVGWSFFFIIVLLLQNPLKTDIGINLNINYIFFNSNIIIRLMSGPIIRNYLDSKSAQTVFQTKS